MLVDLGMCGTIVSVSTAGGSPAHPPIIATIALEKDTYVFTAIPTGVPCGYGCYGSGLFDTNRSALEGWRLAFNLCRKFGIFTRITDRFHLILHCSRLSMIPADREMRPLQLVSARIF